jgi:superfamily II DNA or RNA helicase
MKSLLYPRNDQVTLVVVPAGHIGKQWGERINQYLPNCRVGTLQADVYDYEDKVTLRVY